MGKAAKQKPSYLSRSKRLLSCCLFLVGVLVAMAACGKDAAQEFGQSGQVKEADVKLESEEDLSSGTNEGNARESETDSSSGEGTEDGPIAVADFSYMLLDTIDLNDYVNPALYVIDGEWLYYSREVNTAGEGVFPPDYHDYISRGRILDGWQEEEFIVQPKDKSLIRLHALLADG